VLPFEALWSPSWWQLVRPVSNPHTSPDTTDMATDTNRPSGSVQRALGGGGGGGGGGEGGEGGGGEELGRLNEEEQEKKPGFGWRRGPEGGGGESGVGPLKVDGGGSGIVRGGIYQEVDPVGEEEEQEDVCNHIYIYIYIYISFFCVFLDINTVCESEMQPPH